MITSYYSSRI